MDGIASNATAAELGDALASGCAEVASFFEALTPEQLVTRRPEEWAPIDDLEHLCLSLEPVVRALDTPPDQLTSRFGTATRPSDTYPELETRYLARLAEGVKAPPPVIPPARPDVASKRHRDELLSRWAELGGGLRRSLQQWSDEDLDRCQLPHPALGQLTMREMLFFTHLHNRHHIGVARRRLGWS